MKLRQSASVWKCGVRLLLLGIVVLSFCFQLSAQAKINGRIISSDESDGLPFASIYTTQGEFVFSNNQGFFTINGPLGKQVTIQFLGYRDTTLLLSDQNMVIELQSDVFMTAEVVITDKDYVSPYKLLAAARKQYQKEKGDELKMKLFVNRETSNNGAWSDRTEVLYNYLHKNRRMFDLKFKHGKSFFNEANDMVLTLDLFHVMKEDWVFDKEIDYLYPSMLSESSKKKMAKKYAATYQELTTNNVEYYVINSKPLDNTLYFESQFTIEKETNNFVEIVNTIKNPASAKFRSVRTNEPIDLNELQIRYEFMQYEGMTVLKHIDVDYSYELNSTQSSNTLAFHFYDIESPFAENVTAIRYPLLTDYQKIWVTPYSEDFWEAQNISESKLDTALNYVSMSTSVKSLLDNKLYLTLEDVRALPEEHFWHRPKLNDGSIFDYKADPMMIPTQLHVHAFFHLNTYTSENKFFFESTPLVYYPRTFIHITTPLVLLQFQKELKIIEKQAKLLQDELSSLDKNDLKSVSTATEMIAKYDENLKRLLSKQDNYQFQNWEPYYIHEQDAFKRRINGRY